MSARRSPPGSMAATAGRSMPINATLIPDTMEVYVVVYSLQSTVYSPCHGGHWRGGFHPQRTTGVRRPETVDRSEEES